MIRNGTRLLLAGCSAALLACAAASPAHPAVQSVAPTDLGTLGGSYSFAYAVNATGQTVGVSYTAGDTYIHAFSWTEGDGMVDLGTLGGNYSEADGINNDGMVVGKSYLAGDSTRHAFLWTQADGMVDLGTLGGTYSEALAVNSSGQVVGYSGTPGDLETHAFSWTEAGGMVDLGTLGGSGSAMSCCLSHTVSDAGHVVGQSSTAGNAQGHAFLWTEADGMTDLGTLPGGTFSIAYAVNSNGQVVGQTNPPDYVAFSWTQSGGFVNLGIGSANAVNESGQVVGARNVAQGVDHAFAWTQAGGMVDIGTLGGNYAQAVAVNSGGQTVGVSSLAGGNQHGFSWTQSGGIMDLDTLGGDSSYAQAVGDNGDVVGWASTGDGSTHAALWQVPSDTTAPTVHCDSADGSWHADNVSIACTAEDSGSGLADPGDASFSLTTSVPVGTEAADAETGMRDVCDNAGNCATAGPVSGNKVDRKAPQITCRSADGIWHAVNVSIGCTATDGGSGLASTGDASFSLSTSVSAGNETASASTDNRVVQDEVGNSATAGPITGNKVDRKAPQITCGSSDGVWHAVSVSIGCTATDGGAGLALVGDASFSLSTSVAAGNETANAATNSHPVADAVGNSATAGPVSGNKVDRKAPTIAITAPAQNATYTYRQPVPASYSCTDGGSGVAQCSGNVANGANIPSTNPGANTFTVNARDNVGNQAPALTRNYNVTFVFQGFLYPQNQPVLNVVQAGRITAVRFNLFDYFGVTIFNTFGTNIYTGNSPSSAQVTCPSGSTYNATQTTTAGTRYDTTNRRYEYGFTTQTGWAGTCRVLSLRFKDGTQKQLTYRFR